MANQASAPCEPAGRIDVPPRGGSYLRLPEAFGQRFAVFVDTEEEFDWSGPFRRDQRSTETMAEIGTIHKHFSGHGIRPVYLIDHPVATDPRAVATLRRFQDDGECTIGAHLHPWVNPPHEEQVNALNSFAGNLPMSLERAKIGALTDTIEAAFGHRPTVYRAGRYGVGPNTATILRDLGYRVDVSVRALFDYRDKSGPDFRRMKPFPYRFGGLLEVPLTAAYTGALRAIGGPLYAAAKSMGNAHGLLARTGLLSRVAFTPEGMPLGDVVEALDRLLDDGLQLFSISFHSPSLVPGHTPYVRDAADLARFYAWWDGLFEAAARRGLAPASMEEIEAAAALAVPRARPLANGIRAPLSASRA